MAVAQLRWPPALGGVVFDEASSVWRLMGPPLREGNRGRRSSRLSQAFRARDSSSFRGAGTGAVDAVDSEVFGFGRIILQLE